jgi:hypothetical protein
MPTSQNASDVGVRFKLQTGIGVPASGTGASGLVVTGGQITPNVNTVVNDDIRSDGMTERPKQGSKSWTAAYPANLKTAVYDPLFEALLRTTYSASATITQTDVTSVTTTTSTIVGASGSFLTAQGGLQKGDMIKLTGFADAANNSKWIRVVDVTATVITVPTASLVLNATPDTTFSIIRAKRAVQYAGSTLTDRYFTLEEFLVNIAGSTRGVDGKVVKIEITAAPNQNVKITVTWMGLGVDGLDSGTTPTSPIFSSVTIIDNPPLRMADGIIRINSTDYCILTGFTLTIDLAGAAVDTLCLTANDVSTSPARISGSISMIQQDMTFVKGALLDSVFSLFLLCSEAEADPADFIGFWLGNVALQPGTAPIAATGMRTPTFNFTAGIDHVGGANPATMIKVVSSAP